MNHYPASHRANASVRPKHLRMVCLTCHAACVVGFTPPCRRADDRSLLAPDSPADGPPAAGGDSGGESSDSDSANVAGAEAEQAAAAEAEEVRRNLGGRPSLVDPDVTRPVAGGCVPTLRLLLGDLFSWSNTNNISQRASAQLFELMQDHLPVGNTMPRHPQAVRMLLRLSPVQAKRYAVCINDCTMSRVDLTDPERIKQVRKKMARGDTPDDPLSNICRVCKKAYANLKGIPFKVSQRCGARAAQCR